MPVEIAHVGSIHANRGSLPLEVESTPGKSIRFILTTISMAWVPVSTETVFLKKSTIFQQKAQPRNNLFEPERHCFIRKPISVKWSIRSMTSTSHLRSLQRSLARRCHGSLAGLPGQFFKKLRKYETSVAPDRVYQPCQIQRRRSMARHGRTEDRCRWFRITQRDCLYRNDPPVNDGRKIIFADSDHINPCGCDNIWYGNHLPGDFRLWSLMR